MVTFYTIILAIYKKLEKSVWTPKTFIYRPNF